MFNFPWSNFHELNLDWILSVVKEAKEIFVKGEGDIQHAVETADQALETAEQAAAGVIADGAVTIPKLNSEVYSLLAYCVSGSVAPNFIPAGALVILRKSTIYNVSDGIYTATRNIPQAAIITAADLDQSATLYREGGMNYLLHNEEKLSHTIDLIKDGLVILVSGDEASAAVPADGLVYVVNNTHGLTEGFYFNSSGAAFPPTGGTADSDSFTAVNNILNALQTALTTLGSDDISNDSTVTGVSVTDALDAVKNTLTQLGNDVDDLEAATEAIKNGLAIPQTGNNASQSIPAGAFIYLTDNSDQTNLPDGFYENTSGSNIGSGSPFTTSNLTRQETAGGALNTINNALVTLSNKVNYTKVNGVSGWWTDNITINEYQRTETPYGTFISVAATIKTTALQPLTKYNFLLVTPATGKTYKSCISLGFMGHWAGMANVSSYAPDTHAVQIMPLFGTFSADSVIYGQIFMPYN